MASTKTFGDPCPGTVKYLEVQYQCIPGKEFLFIDTTSFFSYNLVCCHLLGYINRLTYSSPRVCLSCLKAFRRCWRSKQSP